MRPQIVRILASVLCIITSTSMLAQLTGGGSGPPPPTTPPPELPLDSGILILVFIGFVYGCYVANKKLRGIKNSK